MENSKNGGCIVLTDEEIHQPAKKGWTKYQLKYYYLEESGVTVKGEAHVQALSISAVFKYANRQIFSGLGGLEGGTIKVKKHKKVRAKN